MYVNTSREKRWSCVTPRGRRRWLGNTKPLNNAYNLANVEMHVVSWRLRWMRCRVFSVRDLVAWVDGRRGSARVIRGTGKRSGAEVNAAGWSSVHAPTLGLKLTNAHAHVHTATCLLNNSVVCFCNCCCFNEVSHSSYYTRAHINTHTPASI